jgi:hypothetical protein
MVHGERQCNARRATQGTALLHRAPLSYTGHRPPTLSAETMQLAEGSCNWRKGAVQGWRGV